MVRSSYSSTQARAGVGDPVRLSELIGALSHALDLTEGQPPGHCVRSCWVGVHVGKALGIDPRAMADLYYTLLLKDLGCSSNAARICSLYLADDIRFKRDFKTIDGSLAAALRFVFAHTGLESGLAERMRALVNILQNGGEIAREMIETRCHRGADIAAKMRFSTRVQDGIRSLDEHWNGAGQPLGLTGDAIPVNASIALLAQVVDVFHTERGRTAAVAEARARSGSWFAPEIVTAFLQAQAAPGFWEVLGSEAVTAHVLELDPAVDGAPVDDTYLDEIASAFADIVDAKSSFTADHSRRVTLYADMIAEEFGFGPDHRRWLRRAGLLHDIGKLAVSNQVLDKPGRPDEAEWQAIRMHPVHGEEILARVSAFRDIAPLAGGHHERLDGRGYPRGLKGDEICLETRILTVADVFDALTADRPYRAAMPIAEAFAILDKDTGAAFDADCVAALKRAHARLGAAPSTAVA
jgi:HD-GYP domain-containing protein (c-di-GMP phosphodiesterase class II)